MASTPGRPLGRRPLASLPQLNSHKLLILFVLLTLITVLLTLEGPSNLDSLEFAQNSEFWAASAKKTESRLSSGNRRIDVDPVGTVGSPSTVSELASDFEELFDEGQGDVKVIYNDCRSCLMLGKGM
jgi:hypothetical protein